MTGHCFNLKQTQVLAYLPLLYCRHTRKPATSTDIDSSFGLVWSYPCLTSYDGLFTSPSWNTPEDFGSFMRLLSNWNLRSFLPCRSSSGMKMNACTFHYQPLFYMLIARAPKFLPNIDTRVNNGFQFLLLLKFWSVPVFMLHRKQDIQ